MNRIDQLFKQKESNVLSIYMTAGYPGLNDTVEIIRYLQEYGADMVEIGMPFSDPLADGPVIQSSSQAALKNGMNTSILFGQLAGIREKVSIPLILMGYLNPVIQYGFEKFLEDCRKAGIDGLIIPDLPLDEYETDYLPLFRDYEIYLSLLISPQTDFDRIKRISSLSDGFLYMVSDSSTTGAKGAIGQGQMEYFRRISQMNIKIPKLIGFGISNNETFKIACKFANGAIIGSAFIESLRSAGNIEFVIKDFLDGILLNSGG